MLSAAHLGKAPTRPHLNQPTSAPKQCKCLFESGPNLLPLLQKEAAPAAHSCHLVLVACGHLGSSQGDGRAASARGSSPLAQPARETPHSGLLQFRWKWCACRAEWHGLLHLRSHFGMASCWVCSSATRLHIFPFWQVLNRVCVSFLHISHPRKSPGWLWGGLWLDTGPTWSPYWIIVVFFPAISALPRPLQHRATSKTFPWGLRGGSHLTDDK